MDHTQAQPADNWSEQDFPVLGYRTSPGTTQGARATPVTRPDPGGDTGE